MYPDELTFDARCGELSYKHQNGQLCLRLSSLYPLSAFPQVISAFGPSKNDIHDKLNDVISKQQLGESCLDAIIADFMDMTEGMTEKRHEQDGSSNGVEVDGLSETNVGGKTVIIWLHHLLATSKRKQALSPTSGSPTSMSGITKPGYPGVLLFSGITDVVNAHVQLLKSLRWQAFQVRYEADERWIFSHGDGIIEVETMGEVVNELKLVDRGKETFMEAMKMK
jgi:hypothetical protein